MPMTHVCLSVYQSEFLCELATCGYLFSDSPTTWVDMSTDYVANEQVAIATILFVNIISHL